MRKDGRDDDKTTKSQSKPGVGKILGERNQNDHESGGSIDQVDKRHLHLGKGYMYTFINTHIKLFVHAHNTMLYRFKGT